MGLSLVTVVEKEVEKSRGAAINHSCIVKNGVSVAVISQSSRVISEVE